MPSGPLCAAGSIFAIGVMKLRLICRVMQIAAAHGIVPGTDTPASAAVAASIACWISGGSTMAGAGGG